ncbi:MAG TPA: hypothetical protein VF278_09710 [Pirellulales bacterium]
MRSSSSRRGFIAGAAALVAAIVAKCGRALGAELDGHAAHGRAAFQTVDDTSPAGFATTEDTYDRHARLLAVTYPCDTSVTTVGYSDA